MPHVKNIMIRTNKKGTTGRAVTLITNNFRLKFGNNAGTISQYDLAIVDPQREVVPDVPPPVPSKFVCEEVFRKLDLEMGWAYDGKKNLYHPSTTNINTATEVKVGRTTYRVSIQGPVAKVSAKDILEAVKRAGSVVPVDAVNVFNIVLSQGFKTPDYTTIHRAFFEINQDAPNIPGGLKLYSGISATVTPTEDFGITIRVLKTYQVVYPGGCLLDFIKDNIKKSGGNSEIPRTLTRQQIKYFNTILKSIKVQTEHLKYTRKYTLSGLHDKSANQTIIDDLSMSVTTYFKASYNITLNYPDLPLVKVGGKTKLPIELCTILKHQPYYTTLNAAQQKDMIKIACRKPDEKMRDINAAATEVSQVASNFTNAGYDFQVDPRAIEITGRVLKPPDMGSKVERGAWRMTAVKKPSSHANSWSVGVICLSAKHCYTENLHNKFMQVMEERSKELKIGLNTETFRNAPLQFVKIDNVVKAMKEMGKHYTFIILDSVEETYGDVKLAEKLERKTQCIKMPTVEKVCGLRTNRPDINTADNILKKLNVKIGGVNFGIDMKGLPQQIFKEPVIIVGADVTHFTSSDRKPSIAAVVATSDIYAGQYISRIKVMYPKDGRKSVEYIHDMKDIMTSILKEFRTMCKKRPAKIIYYRDGVSDGQFENTVMEELCGIQDACTGLHPEYKPKISVVVCTKRHKQRFVVKSGKQPINMEPGTVIDTGVVSPNYHNFFLCSHQAIQGTSVPCHYYVLYDDSKLTPDMWQMLSFFLCHTYARCSRSVSYPAPVYYAHLACASARSRMLSGFDWNCDELPTGEEIERKVRPEKFNMFFI